MDYKEVVQPFIQDKVLVLDSTTPSNVAARAMAERRVGSVVIIDKHNNTVGLVTDRDLVCNLLAFDLPADTPISEFMTENVRTITESATVEQVLEIMMAFGVRRIPVVRKLANGSERCVGIVCLDDLIAAQAVDSAVLSNIVRSQVKRRAHASPRNQVRSEDRREQKLGRFFNEVVKYTGLSRDYAESLSRMILNAIVRRVPYTAAANFISQLPALLQDELFALPAGPDDSITAELVHGDVRLLFRCTDDQAKELIAEFWMALANFLNVKENSVPVLRQLSMPWKRLLTGADIEESVEETLRWEALVYPHHIF